MRVANRPRGMSPTKPPGWREMRAERIARQAQERAAKQAERAERAERRPSPVGGKPSAVVSRSHLQQQRGVVERVMAWVVLLLSFLGSIVALHGGWTAFIASLTDGPLMLGALLGGTLLQLVLTFLEWWYFDRVLLAWGARLADTALTAVGYGPLFVPPLAAWLALQGVGWPAGVAWGIISLVSLGVAWFPESRLVD